MLLACCQIDMLSRVVLAWRRTGVISLPYRVFSRTVTVTGSFGLRAELRIVPDRARAASPTDCASRKASETMFMHTRREEVKYSVENFRQQCT